MTRANEDANGGRTPVDWAVIRARVQTAADGPVEDAEAVLRQRAVMAAREDEKSRDVPEGPEFLVFILAAQAFALPARSVREVLAVGPITPLPGLPDWLQGVTPVRSRVRPVVDARRLLDVAENKEDRSTVLWVEQDGVEFGLLIGSVAGFRAAPTSGTTHRSPSYPKFVDGFLPDGTPILSLSLLSVELLAQLGAPSS